MPVSGAKNSALKLMAATLLAPGKTTLQNVPDISDVHVMGKVLKGMGATIDVLDEHTLEIDTSQVDSWEAPYELVAKMRASTAVMGPLLGRFHRAKIAMPGGCNLGARKIDMHILGLEALGVEFDTAHGYINANAPQGLRGTTVTLEFASVGATENLIMASVRAQGTTVIDNAAREPEIVDLANMLNEMGAKIVGAGTPVVTIEGVEELHPVTHRVVGDRIEAGTFNVAGALMADDRGVDVTGFCPIHLGMVLKKMELMGIDCERVEDGVHVNRAERIKPVDIQTLPFPGFPTDMQAQIMVLSALANQILNNFDATKIFGLVNSLSDMLVTDMSVQDIVATVNAMRGMDVDGIYSANLPSYADDSTMIDGVSYVFVYEDELKEMMERVDAGKDPKGPNTMGLSDGSSSTIGDLNNNTSDDYANGTATSSVSSDDSDDSGDSSDSDYYEEPTGDGNGYEANY